MMTENYAAYLAKEAESLNSILHQFILLYSNSDDSLHIFFEGEEDSKFYLPFIRNTSSRSYLLYQCGGKPRLREVHSTLSSQGYTLDNCLFFADRDHDDFLDRQIKSTDTIYLTDSYSVENEFTTPSALKVALSDIAGLSPGSNDFTEIESDVLSAMREFHSVMRSLTAWSIATRKAGGKLNLNNANLANVFSISDDAKPSRKNGGFSYFKKQACACETRPAFSQFLAFREQLDPEVGFQWVRGKYEIWFFQIALVKAFEKRNATRVSTGLKRLKIPPVLREQRLMDVLGGRVPLPETLKAYLSTRLTETSLSGASDSQH